MDRTGLVHVLIFIVSLLNPIETVVVEQQALLGCGVITRPIRVYQFSPANYDFNSNTPGSCMQACSSAGYAYASVSAGYLCFCGSSTVNTTLLNSTTTSCQVTVCPGDTNYYCGDIDHELVYTSVGVIDSASIVTTGGATASNLMVNQNYQFLVSYQGAVSYINYLIDFGDGTKTGWFSGVLNTTTTISHVFTETGQFAISVAARSVVGMQPTMTSMTVKVFDSIGPEDLSMTCPNVTATLKTVSCTFVAARGSDLTATINYNTSVPIDSITNVPNAQYYTFGSSFVTANPTIDASINLLTASDIVILPQSTITAAGRIGSIQFYSSGAGTVNIYLLRRTCTSPLTYCYGSNTCGSCSSPYALQCSAYTYSTISNLCANTTVSQLYQSSVYNGAQFDVVSQWTVATSGAGYQQVTANTTANMINRTAYVGDILAFKGLNIAKQISADTTEDYRCTSASGSPFTCSIGSLSTNNTKYHYLLQITIIQAVQIAPLIIYSDVGNFNVQGTLTQHGVTTYSASAILPVLYGIESINIVGASAANVNTMLTFVAQLYPANATASIFIWYINNNNTLNSTSNTLNISFSVIGTYVIKCQAQNLISMKLNSTTVIIQDIIQNFTLHAGNLTNVSISQPMENAKFQIRMATGSNYACRINFDTSQTDSGLYFYTYGYVPGSYVTHQYLNEGAYNVYANCENSVSNVSYSFVHYVQYPITGLQLQQNGAIKNTNYRLNFTIAQGTSPQFRILINGTQVSYTYNPTYNLVQTSLFPGQSSSMNYTVEIYAWNYISSTYLIDSFSIVTLLSNPQIRASAINTSFPGPILFEYTMDSGSNVQISFSFGDTLADNPVTCIYNGDYPANIWNSCTGTNHVFQIPGTINIIVKFENAATQIYKYLTVTLTTSVNPIKVLTGLQIGSGQCAAAYVENRAIASFLLQAANSTAKPASNAQVIIIPDVVNHPTTVEGPYQVTFDYFASPAVTTSGLNVLYTSPGIYTAVFQVSNSIDSTNVSCNVQVVSILQQVYYSITPLNWQLTSSTALVASIYIGDPNPGAVTFTWDFGDGTTYTQLRNATQYNQADWKSHNYTSVGVYTLTITAQGPVNNVTQTFPITVQYPVTDFTVNFSGPAGSSYQIVYSGVSTTISLSVKDSSSPSASNAMIYIDFNDTSPLATNSVVNTTLPYTGSYTYLSPGIYNVNVTVYNQVSSVPKTLQITISAQFIDYTFNPCYLEPTLTSSLSDKCNLALTGGQYYIPKQNQLVLYVTWSNPSAVPNLFQVLFNSGMTTVFNQSLILSQVQNISQLVGITSGTPLFRLVVDLESNNILIDGSYVLTVQTSNPLYSATYSANIYILSAIAGLTISDQGILVGPNQPKTFIGMYQNFSALSCLYIKYSDNTINCYGSLTRCSSLPTDVTLKTCSSVQSFTYTNTSSITFTRAFNKSNSWLYAYAWNELTSPTVQTYFGFPISTYNCNSPSIQFQIYNPVLRWARQIKRSEAFSVNAKSTLNCSQSLNNTKQWQIYQCNSATGLCQSTSFLRQLVSQLSSAQNSEIYLTSQQLPYGYYLFNYTITMTYQTRFSTSSFTYIQIIASDIQVNLLDDGTSMITNGFYQSILFQPGVYSIDPDSNYFNPNNWTYEYYCRIYGQASYPMYNGQEIPIESTMIDSNNPSCFATSGNTSLFKYGPNNNQSILYIQPQALQADRSYEFKVILTNIYDTSLTYTGYAVVEVEDVNSVLVSVQCVIEMCSPNVEYQRINPTNQALLTSNCIQNCDNAEQVSIQWNIYQGFQTNYPNADIKWVLYTQMDTYDNSLFFGRYTKNLTATSGLFSANPTIQYWQFEASYFVQTSSGSAIGAGSIRFSINSPPQNGTCTISQTTGTTMTPFSITCLNWLDSDGIKDYAIYVLLTTNGTRQLIAFTLLSQAQVYLPIGNVNTGYTLELTVDIRDIYDAVTTYSLPTITVTPNNASLMAFIQSAQLALTQGLDNNDIEKFLYAGDQNTVCQLMLSISQTLNSMSTNIENFALTGNIPAEDIFVAGLYSSSSTYPSTNTSANTTQALTTYTAALNKQAIARDYAIQFINNLTITNMDSINLQASTLAELTGTTSELTRQAATFATSKCTDLVNSLNQIVNTVSYEDVQLAVQSIAEIASNALVSANAAVENRGVVLSLDYNRANMLPPDYETDIETVWSNPNLFADGDDFSWETIQKNRNLYYQQQSSIQILGQVDSILSKTVNILSYHMNVGQTNVISTNSIAMTTKKLQVSQLNSFTVSPTNDTIITLPSLSYCKILFNNNNSCTNTTPITANAIVLPLAPIAYNGRYDVPINMSRSLSLTLYDSQGDTLSIQNLSTPIQMIISRDPNLLLPLMTYENMSGQTNSTTGRNNNRQFALYYVNVTSASSSLTLSATLEIQSENSAIGYMIIYRFDAIPILNSSMNLTDGYRVFCPGNQILTSSNGYVYSYFLPNTQTVNHQYAMFGIRELDSNESVTYCSGNSSVLTAPITDQTVNFTANYYIRTYTSGCYYLNSNSHWQTDNLIVGPLTSHSQTECYSNHLTTFASGWIVLPAPINWNYVFANMDFMKNKTIYLTMIILAILYILFMIYARYKDKKDVEKLGVTPLPDNLLNDKYYYQIVVFTGLRKDAGTKSKVHFIISGDDEETGVRTFEDPHRTILQRGGIDSFIMGVPKSLGRLNYMRIWHDNSGRGNTASWFLKYIVVRDLQTMEKSHFISQQWFAVEKDDGVIDRLVPVAGEEQKQEFAYLLSKKTYHSMSDGHLWFSVFTRPPSTRFTRTQRCTCCFVLLLMSMLMNIMYYDQSNEANTRTAGGIVIGPFLVTPEQIGIGIMVELICFLPSTFLVEMFRRLRLRRRPTPPVREALKRMQEEHQRKQQQAELNDIHPQLTNYIVNPDPILSNYEFDKMRRTVVSPPMDKKVRYATTNNHIKKRKQKKTLPWWFIFIAYGLSALVVGISVLFIIARGIEFGNTKTQKWLTSSISGFFSSILLTQPLKVILAAIFFTLILRRDDDDIIENDDDDDLFLDGDEEYIHGLDDGSLLTFRSKSGHVPLSEGEIAYAREKRLNEIKMWQIIRELIAYASFLWILYVVSYSNRDPNSYYLMQNLKNDLLNLNNQTNDFTQIYSIDQYWNWLDNTFVPRIRASDWYNGDAPRNLSGFIGDKTNRILGWATMRQLRVKRDSCKILSAVANIITSCEDDYSIVNEDKQSFTPGWGAVLNSTNEDLGDYYDSIRQAFVYNHSDSLDTYAYTGEHATYGSGGYVYAFRGKMSEMLANISLLKELSWIDKQTRAVIIQMSLYNPNVNLFVFVTVVAEFLSTGSVYPSARFEPLPLLGNYGGFAVFTLVCAIFYVLFIIYYTIFEIRSMFSHGVAYFKDFWSYPDIGIIACSWTGVGIYVWRIREGDRVGKLFRESNGYMYVNLQLASYVNDILTFLLGFCCFFGTIKFLKLLRFNKRISMLQSTLAYAARDLISFTFMFSILYFGYLSLFYLLFNSKIWACSDLLKTAQMLFEMMLLKFDVSDLYAANIFLGPFCFTLFIIFVVFICMNMFISIIADSFRVVRRNLALQNSDHEIIDFMINQMKKWTGLGKTYEMDRLHTNPYDGSRVQYLDPVTSFPQKIDELLIALNKIYMDTKRHDTFAFRPIAPELLDLKGQSKETN